jgi:hypothetical protein
VRHLGRRVRDPRETAGRALRVAATFCFFCVLWSLWNSDSISEWLALWSSAAAGGWTGVREP